MDWLDHFFSDDEQSDAPISLEKIGFGAPRHESDNHCVIRIPVAYKAPNAWEVVFKAKGPCASNCLVIGSPGSGKSTMLENLILNGAMKYSPEELQFYIIDLKDAMLSDKFSLFKLPHIKFSHDKMLSLEDASVLLSNISSEKERRFSTFKKIQHEHNVNIHDILDYNMFVKNNNVDEKPLPTILVVIEECARLLSHPDCYENLIELLIKCRAAGIHFILSTQCIESEFRTILDYINTVCCFRLRDYDSLVLFPDKKELRELAAKLPMFNFLVSSDQFKSYAQVINACVGSDGGMPYADKIKEKWGTGSDIKQVNGMSSLPYSDIKDTLSPTKDYAVPLGVDIMNDIKYVSIKQNLWLCGDKALAKDATTSIWYSIIKGITETNSKVFLVDADVEKALTTKISNDFKNSNISFYSRKGYMEALNEVYNIFKNRDDEVDNDRTDIYLIVNQIHDISSYINNDTYEENKLSASTQSTSTPKFGDLKDFDYDSIIAALFGSQNKPKLQAREGLFDLVSRGLDYNIHVLLAFADDRLTDSYGNPLFLHNQRNLLKNFKSKIILKRGRCTSLVDEYNNKSLQRFSSIKEEIDEQENIALLISDDTTMDKVKFIQY